MEAQYTREGLQGMMLHLNIPVYIYIHECFRVRVSGFRAQTLMFKAYGPEFKFRLEV